MHQQTSPVGRHETPSDSIASPSSSRTPVPATPRKKRRSRRWWWLLVLLLLVALGGGSYLKSKQEKPIVVTVQKAARKTIIQLVSATGKVQPEVEVKISPEVAGEIIELPVIDGQTVKKGDLLIRIRPDNYQAQVAQQEAAINSAKAMSAQNYAQLLKAQQDLKRYSELYQRHVINDSDLLSYQTVAQVAEATYKASLSEISRAESLLNQSRDLLAKTTIYAPMDGIISLLSVKLGERVVATGQFQGTEVMRVADLGSMEARVNVNENDVVNVKFNDQANISIDAYPGRTFRGTVYQIANTAVTTGANTQEEVTNFEVRIRIQAEGARLRPGMSTTADIETATVQNVVAVPIQAVTVRTPGDKLSPEEREKQKAKSAAAAGETEDNSAELNKTKQAAGDKLVRAKQRRVIFVKDAGIVHQREVETGIADNTDIEVKSGVKPGDEVVSGSYRAISRLLKEGAKIVLEQAGT
ncbi:MAG: efflux RND transporter periplasmic adaptor subunit [Verrucomicrobia bacterium]|nr:efflux RND transporter periplasmic adaptor subunit [Verrucomicrobiota bacterium]